MDDLQQSSIANLNRYMLSLQQELDRYKDLPELLSSHSELVNLLLLPGTPAVHRVNLYLEKVNQTIGASDTYLMDREGTTLAASNWSLETSFVGGVTSLSGPISGMQCLGGRGVTLPWGPPPKKRGYFFSYPVQYGGETLGVIVVKIDLNDIETDWNDPMTDILVTDEDGVIFISTRTEWKFRTLEPLPQEDLKRIVSSLRYGDHELRSLPLVDRKPGGKRQPDNLAGGRADR